MAFQDYNTSMINMDEKLSRIQQILEILENEGFIESTTSSEERRRQRRQGRARRTRKQRKKRKKQKEKRFIKDYRSFKDPNGDLREE